MSNLQVHVAGILLFLVGGWFFSSVFMAVAASANFRVMTRENLPEADRIVAETPNGPTRTMGLRYFASEINRAYFGAFNRAQFGLAFLCLTLAIVVRSTSQWPVLFLAAALALCGVMLYWFTPKIIDLGRTIDFIPRDPTPRHPDVEHFYRLHGAYVWIEMSKMIALLASAFFLIRSFRSR